MMIPEAWSGHETMDQERKDFSLLEEPIAAEGNKLLGRPCPQNKTRKKDDSEYYFSNTAAFIEWALLHLVRPC